MISVCENKLANYQKNEKEIYRRMFQPSTTTSTLNQQHQTKNIKKKLIMRIIIGGHILL